MTPKICTKEQTENTHRKTKPQLGLKYASQTTSIQHMAKLWCQLSSWVMHSSLT